METLVPKICYVKRKFSSESQSIIDTANEILMEYESAGYVLTLRQLYYQFVSRDILPNNTNSYNRLGSVINDACLAGQIDWKMMEDRTRNLKQQASWDSPSDIIDACARSYKIDLWEGQEYRPEVWIEKDALAGVFERVCNELRVPWFSCRGYTSQSEMWVAGRRLKKWMDGGQTPVIFHFGDHDPSGVDMSRDITNRLKMFMGGVEFNRLALNMDQVEEYSPPPNPAKITDSRHGDESWELDALQPDVLAALVRDSITSHRRDAMWRQMVAKEQEQKKQLQSLADSWEEVADRLNGTTDEE